MESLAGLGVLIPDFCPEKAKQRSEEDIFRVRAFSVVRPCAAF